MPIIKRKYKYVFLIFVLLFLGYGFTQLDRWLTVDDHPTPSDVIICLGGGDGRRWEKCIDLYNAKYGKAMLVTVSEFYRNKEFHGKFQELVTRYFVSKGVTREDIFLNPKSLSTYDEA